MDVQERDNMQKTQFLKAMSDMWTSFDGRVLRFKVCLCGCVQQSKFVNNRQIDELSVSSCTAGCCIESL